MTLNSLLYISLILALVASLSHVAFAFSTVNNGDMLSGYISAVAVDLGMLALAGGINRRKSQKVSTKSLWAGVIVFSLISTYANWLSGISHVVSIESYQENWLVSLRPIILSAVLPLLVIYLSEVVSGDYQRHQIEAHKEAQKVSRQAHKSVSFGPNDTGNGAADDTMGRANDTRQAQKATRQERFVRLYQAGKSQNEIADELNVSLTTVKRDARELKDAGVIGDGPEVVDLFKVVKSELTTNGNGNGGNHG
jgi:DNA-binding CsgD family transcriptional regulator